MTIMNINIHACLTLLVHVAVVAVSSSAAFSFSFNPSSTSIGSTSIGRGRAIGIASPPFVRSNNIQISSSTSTSTSTSTSLKESTTETTETTATNSNSNSNSNDNQNKNKNKNKNKKIAVLICPAQFCVPADYETFSASLRAANPNIICTKVAPLPRTEWIRVAKQLPTSSFFTASLQNSITLDWYFDAIETALSEIFAEYGDGDDINICIISHSIGGWVARAYLGGLSNSSTAVYKMSLDKISSLVTLGTPHSSPNTALVDQTRGLLKEVERTYSCSSGGLLEERGINITCVGSTAIRSRVFTPNVEELVATTSYLPLVNKWTDVLLSSSTSSPEGMEGMEGMEGDGIIPKELAFMPPPARAIEVQRCSVTGNAVRHAHVLPTPWNLWDGYAKSIDLPEDYVWYGSEGVIDQWIDSVQ